MTTLTSNIPVWAHHLLSGSDTGVEHSQILGRPTTSDAFIDCGSSSPVTHHWESHLMEYPPHFMIPQQAHHMDSNNHHSALQWANAGDAAHHTSLLQQHCSEYHPQQQQQQQLETVHHQDHRNAYLLHQVQQQQQAKSVVKHLPETHEERRDSKRPATSMSAQEEVTNSESIVKKPRVEQQQTSSAPFKMQVRKEKLGERITALQQLVSPFGKTDTASVLLEAIGYIKFLQEQVQVLSTPYMKPSISPSSLHHDDMSKLGWAKAKSEDSRQDLRSRGLCLVPVSCTLQVANDNGADFWTPAIGGSCR
ncbi:hypothetical protein R1flu_009474 [Riccia fluitans]|uniref:BHLH domain-containing protein n=1 Tax=Riccia fluitans TaxID=41844 RepID=A0ABD1Z579_9MARC